ncbi:DUF4384 domain-containing protein [Candidatus Pelagibacter sp.]|nr:DUF4384 domain-containing protein [Candidatus Pelagibacter sp.]
MIRYFLIIFFIIFSASAEVVITEGSYLYTSNISEDEACSLAKERAQLKALEKVLGQKISSEEMENCSEVDGKTSCERNQFFLSSFDGEITGTEPVGKAKIIPQEIVGSDKKASLCIVKFKFNVEKTTTTLDANFDFNVKLNQKNFRDGEELKIDIELNEPFYLTVFQVLPYEKKDYQVYKLFPNELEQDNFIKDNSFNLPQNAKYEIYFPDVSNKNSVDEYLVFVASEKDIKWLEKYAKKEDLKSAYIKENSIKYMYKEYTIYK